MEEANEVRARELQIMWYYTINSSNSAMLNNFVQERPMSNVPIVESTAIPRTINLRIDSNIPIESTPRTYNQVKPWWLSFLKHWFQIQFALWGSGFPRPEGSRYSARYSGVAPVEHYIFRFIQRKNTMFIAISPIAMCCQAIR